MRTVITDKSDTVDLRADETDWLPTTINGRTHHLLLNDEDFCKNKKEKMKLRKLNRKLKCLERQKTPK